MYKRSEQGWLKHLDFIFLDVLCAQVALMLAYGLRFGFTQFIYADEDFRKMAIWMALFCVIIAVVFALGGAVCTLIGPEKISDLMNTIFQGILTGVNMQNFEAMCWNLVFLYALSAFLSYSQQFITSTVTQYSSRRLRSDIDRKISRLPLRFFDIAVLL